MRPSLVVLVIVFASMPIQPLYSQQDSTASSDDPSSIEAIAKDLAPLVVSDSLFFSYFFEEVNIVDYQRSKLKSLVEKNRKERLGLVADWFEEGKQARSKSTFETFQRKFANEVRDILLPKQLDELRCLTRQRSKLVSMNGAEGFVLPLFAASDLGLSQDEATTLQKELRELIREFENSKRDLTKATWREIKKLMPADSTESLIELATLAPEVEKLDVSRRLRLSDLKTWSSDDFQKFEDSRYYLATVVAVGHEPLKNALSILDFQVSKFSLVYQETIENHDTASFADPVIAKMILATPAGRLTKLKAATRKQLENREKFDTDMSIRIANEVLLPAQNQKLKRLAKFIRWMYETKMNDEFGIVIAWSKSIEDKEFDTAFFVKQVEKSRVSYYEKLGEMRKTKWEEVLACLPDVARNKFQQLYGKPYDYEAEKIQAWDDLRKSSE
ncbi:MAG: hypothetical protein AB8B55_14445 [Mariniblastus sp.]